MMGPEVDGVGGTAGSGAWADAVVSLADAGIVGAALATSLKSPGPPESV